MKRKTFTIRVAADNSEAISKLVSELNNPLIGISNVANLFMRKGKQAGMRILLKGKTK